MQRGILRTCPSAFRYTQQYRLLRIDVSQNCVKVELSTLFRKLALVLVREPDPSPIVTHDCIPLREPFPEMPEIGPFPFHLEVREMTEHANEHGPGSNHRI